VCVHVRSSDRVALGSISVVITVVLLILSTVTGKYQYILYDTVTYIIVYHTNVDNSSSIIHCIQSD
jgi:hypothetical protein